MFYVKINSMLRDKIKTRYTLKYICKKLFKIIEHD